MSNSLIDREITQGVIPIGTPKAYKYDAALVEAAKSAVQQGIASIPSVVENAAEEKVQPYVTEASNSATAAAKSVTQAEAIKNAMLAGYGYPFTASTVADMTDIDKIYVYTGSEEDYINGNWYYYNGSAWVSGGVYNAVAFTTDKALSVSDAAADSKVTGDNIKALNKQIQSLHSVAISGDLNNKTVSTIQGLSVEVDGCVIKLNGTTNGSTSSIRVFSLQENPPKGYTSANNFYNGCTLSNTLLAGHTYRMHAVLVGGTFTSGDNTHGAGTVFPMGTNTTLWLTSYADGYNVGPALMYGDGAEFTPETDMVVGALNFRSVGTRVFNNAVIVAYVEDVTVTSRLVTTDTTLSIDGLPADAKATGESIANAKAEVDYINAEKCVFAHGAIDTGGSTGDIINIYDVETGGSFDYYVSECEPGARFVIYGEGGTTSRRLYAFLYTDDDDQQRITGVRADAGETHLDADYVITAPENASHIVVHCFRDTPHHLYRGLPISLRVNELENKVGGIDAINEMIGGQAHEYTGRCYIKTVDPIDITAYQSSPSFASCVLPCEEGDKFIITGYGGTQNQRLYAFIDEDGYMLSVKAGKNEQADEQTITAPAGTAYLVSNVRVAYPYALRQGESIISRLDDIEESLDGVADAYKIPSYYDENDYLKVSAK